MYYSYRTITNSTPSAGYDGNVGIDENGDMTLGSVGKVLLSLDDITPTQNDQVASKLYVDTEVASAISAIPPDQVGISSLNPTGANTNGTDVSAEGAVVDLFCTGTGMTINGDNVLKKVTFDVTGLNTATGLKVNKAGDTMTGPLIIPGGSTAAPGLGFRFETNTGIAKTGTGQIDFVTMGGSRCTVNSIGMSLPGIVTANTGFSTLGNIIVGGLVDDVDVSTLPGLIATAQTTANGAQTTANNALPLLGGTMQGPINTGGYNIVMGTGLVDGVDVGELPGLIGTAQATANNAIPKIGGLLGSNLDLGHYDLVNVDAISTDTIAASTGATVQVVSNINMNSKSISGIGTITNGLGLQPLKVDFGSSNLFTAGNVFAAGLGEFGAISPAAGTSILVGGILNMNTHGITGVSSITNGLGGSPLNINFGASNLVTSGLVDGVDVSGLPGLITSAQTTANNALPKSGDTMTGPIKVINGSLAVPSINFTNSATTGIYSSGAGSLSLVNSGTARITTTTTGATHTGITDIASLTGCGYQVIYANAAAFPPLFLNNGFAVGGISQIAITLTAGKLIRLYKIGITSAYMFKIVFTAMANRDQVNGYIPEFANFGLSTAIMAANTSQTARFWKYTPDFDGLFFISTDGGFSNGTTYDITGSLILTQDFDV